MDEDIPKCLESPAQINSNSERNEVQSPMSYNGNASFDETTDDQSMWLIDPVCADIKVIVNDIPSRCNYGR
jgi:hypothetical protein